MATVSTISRFSAAADNNSFESKGIKAYSQAYAATSAWVAKGGALRQHVCYAQLTGAMTINATVTALSQFDEVVFHFGTDGTQRIVTFGTNFKSSGTVTIPANKGAIVTAVYDGTYLLVTSREIWA
jgi:hypothetical protein